jgi:transcriptional antiterminator RfaH
MSGWYPVFCKPRGESLAEANLRNQGYAVYLPRIAIRRRRAGAWQQGVEALFPRYLFVRPRDAAQSLAPVRSTLGVADLVRFGGRVAMVPDSVIESLRGCADPGTGVHAARNGLSPGSKVRFIDGPLSGLEGIFEMASGTERAFVLLDMLGKVNRLKVDCDWLLAAA